MTAPLSSPEYDASREGLEPSSTTRQRFVKALTVLTIPTVIIVFILAVQVSKDFQLTGEELIDKFLQVILALVLGLFGVWLLFWAMDRTVGLFSQRWANRLRPWVFVGPALLALGFYLVYPAINTTVISFLDNSGEAFVGLDNYVTILTEEHYQVGIRNSILWVLAVPLLSVIIGLGYAVLADKLPRRAQPDNGSSEPSRS